MAEKGRWLRDNMKNNGDLATPSAEVSDSSASCHNLFRHRHRHPLVNGLSVSRVPLQYSDSTFNGFVSSQAGLPFPVSFEDVNHQTPETRCWNIRGGQGDDISLSETFRGIRISDEQMDDTQVRGLQVDPKGFGFSDGYFEGNIPWSVEKRGKREGFTNAGGGFEGFQSYRHEVAEDFNSDPSLAGLGLQGEYTRNGLKGSYLDHNNLFRPFSSFPCCYGNQMDMLEKSNEYRSDYYHRGEHQQSQASPSSEMDFNRIRGLREVRGANMYSSRLIMDEGISEIPNSMVTQSVMSSNSAPDAEAFPCENSFILQGNSVNYAIDKKSMTSRSDMKNGCKEIAEQNRQRKSSEQIEYFNLGRTSDSGSLFLPHAFTSLDKVQGYIYYIAKDQCGCRFLQRIFDEGTYQDMKIIFHEIINHVGELAMDPFGNYLVQKLLDVCTEEQRMQIVLVVTNKVGQLIRLAQNTHGTRVVQKLIETVKTKKQISLVNSALEPGFLDLIKDANSYHVIQRCLQCFSNEDNAFIFVAAAKFCVDIATHRHGCCVLQSCIKRSVGEYQDKLVNEITRRGFLLAQDPFGNYVVQYIIEQKIPSACANLMTQFKGNFVQLSMQKFSSHVVEKCLKHFEESRPRIILELLFVTHFDQLLQDPYANYVIQSALAVSKGPLHASLVEVVRAHNVLRTSPYCKRIFSRKLMKS